MDVERKDENGSKNGNLGLSILFARSLPLDPCCIHALSIHLLDTTIDINKAVNAPVNLFQTSSSLIHVQRSQRRRTYWCLHSLEGRVRSIWPNKAQWPNLPGFATEIRILSKLGLVKIRIPTKNRSRCNPSPTTTASGMRTPGSKKALEAWFTLHVP